MASDELIEKVADAIWSARFNGYPPKPTSLELLATRQQARAACLAYEAAGPTREEVAMTICKATPDGPLYTCSFPGCSCQSMRGAEADAILALFASKRGGA